MSKQDTKGIASDRWCSSVDEIVVEATTVADSWLVDFYWKCQECELFPMFFTKRALPIASTKRR